VIAALANYELLGELQFCGLRMQDVWDDLPDGEHIERHPPDESGVRHYEVCGRKIGERDLICHALDGLRGWREKFGERAEQARRNEGVDWKAVAHALRAAHQVRELLTAGTITFPRPEAALLLRVKSGAMDFAGEVAPMLEEAIADCTRLSAESALPERCDAAWWDDWTYRALLRHYRVEEKRL
jgi:hypothetical protein